MNSATSAVVRNEVRLFSREPIAILWIIAFPPLLLVVLGFVPAFRETNEDLGGQTVIALYVSICILLSMVVVGAQAMPERLIGYRERKVLRRLRTTPVGPARLLGAQMLINGGAVVVATLLCLTIGRLAYDAPLPQAPLAYALTFLLALGAMLATGAVITALSPTAAIGNVVSMAVMFPSMFTAGVWLPVQAMPDTLQTIVSYSPMGAATQALNEAALGEMPAMADVAVAAGWAAVLTVVAVRTFRWE